MKPLKLLFESKIGELIHCDPPIKRWEASGVLVRDQSFFIVFDDRTEIARLSDDLRPNESNGMFGITYAEYGFEGITFNAPKRRFYLLVEARKHADGCYKAVVVEYDEEFRFLKDRPVEFAFKSNNKGFEAVAHVRRGKKDYLLALCEGNKCKCGKQGRKPGGGRVQLFEKRKKQWHHFDVIPLPPSVPFVDYSGMSINKGRVAIVSQVNSMLWIGEFDQTDWNWRDDGQLYEFPRAENGAILYGNIEGVSWIAPNRIVAVSDRRKQRSQPDKRLSEKDQSIHVFEIPSCDH